jgi:hypothetical protein
MQLFPAGLVFGFFLELTGPNSPLFTLARAEGYPPALLPSSPLLRRRRCSPRSSDALLWAGRSDRWQQ